MFRLTTALPVFVLVCGLAFVFSASMGDPCINLEKTPFEMCMNAGYDKTLPFPDDFTADVQQEIAMELREIFESVRNCSTNGLAEAIECSFVAPKCNSLGDPVYPCKQVCAEYLKQCEHQISEDALDFLISMCLVLSNGSSGCDPCFQPPNFSVNDTVPGPLDRGCQELIFPACKNLGAYNHTLISIPVQKELYWWFYEKEYGENSTETEFPEVARHLFEQYPKCQENIKKLFCGEYFPPCFQGESPRLYSLCQPLCDQIATDCQGLFSHDLIASEYCSTMARGQSKHGYCHSTEWPAAFTWLRYEEATEAPSVVPESHHGTQVWPIVIAVLLPLLTVGLVVAAAIWRKKRIHSPGAAYIKHYEKESEDTFPLET